MINFKIQAFFIIKFLLLLLLFLLGKNTFALPLTNHEIVSNNINLINFDRGLSINSYGVGSVSSFVSIKTPSKNSVLNKYSNPSILAKDGVYIGLNKYKPGYIGMKEVKKSASTDGVPNNSKHILLDISGDGIPDLLFPKEKSLFTHHGKSKDEHGITSFEDASLHTSTDRKIVDFAGEAFLNYYNTPLRISTNTGLVEMFSVIGILHQGKFEIRISKVLKKTSNYFHIRSYGRQPPVINSENFINPQPENYIEVRGEALKVTSFSDINNIYFFIVSQGRGSNKRSFYLTSIVIDKSSLMTTDGTSHYFSRKVVHNEGFVTFSNREEVVDLQFGNFEEDNLPYVALFSTRNQGGSETGVLRLYKVGQQEIDEYLTSVVTTRLFNKNELKLLECLNKDKIKQYIDYSAIRVKSITGKEGRKKPDDYSEFILGGNINIQKCDDDRGIIRRPFVQIFQTSENKINLIKDVRLLKIDGVAEGKSPNIVDLDVFYINNDELPDIGLLDASNNSIIALKQQPRPCLTFITAITHGHQGVDSIMADFVNTLDPLDLLGSLSDVLDTPTDEDPMDYLVDKKKVPKISYNDNYNALLSEVQIEEINAVRRNKLDEPELCPVAHIAVNGHWEQATAQGAGPGHVGGRVLWTSSAVFPLVPQCELLRFIPRNTLRLSGMVPNLYWSSIFWLFVPNPCFYSGLSTSPSNPGAVIRFTLAGMGYGLELYGKNASGSASRLSAIRLANTIDEAVGLARSSMNECTGQIALDAVGFSRGGALTSHAMQNVNIRQLNYNTDASITFIDAIDPSWEDDPAQPYSWSNGDSIRPWARSGFIVGDPVISAAGSAKISSVYSAKPGVQLTGFFSEIEGRIDDNIGAIIDYIDAGLGVRIDLDVKRDIIGLPSGYDRRGNFGNAPVGWFASTMDLSHSETRDNMLGEEGAEQAQIPDPKSVPSGYNLGSIEPSFANATHIGQFINNPRAVAVPDFPGWRRDLFDGFNSDVEYLPARCNQSVVNGDPIVSDEEETLEFSEEYVSDTEFSIAHGIVTNARDLVDVTRQLGKPHDLVNIIPNELVRKLVEITARRGLPVGTGLEGWASPDPCNSDTCPVVVSYADDQNHPHDESRLTDFRNQIKYLVKLPEDTADEEDIKDAFSEWKNTNLDNDQVQLYKSILAGGTRLDDSQLKFDEKSTIRQYLSPDSLKAKKVVVRIVYQRTSKDGELNVSLKGEHLNINRTTTGGDVNELIDFTFDAERTGEVIRHDPEMDSITLQAQNVLISSVSVRANLPWSETGKAPFYEIIELPTGVGWKAANTIAKNRIFDGRRGKLAEFPKDIEQQLPRILDKLNAKKPLWLGAIGSNGTEKGLVWVSSGNNVNGNIVEDDSNSSEEAYLYTLPDGKLKRSGLRASINGEKIGLLVMYE